MEENWGRKDAAVTPDEVTLQEILKPVVGNRKAIRFDLLASGKANTSYKVRLAGQVEPLLLKLHIRDHESCRKEFNLYQKLHDLLPMAEILYFEPSPAAFGFPYSLIRWVEGQHLDHVLAGEDENAVIQTARDLGKVLAAIGDYLFEQPGLLDPDLNVTIPFSSTADSWASFIQRCLEEGQTGHHLGKLWAERLARLVTNNTAFIAGLTETNALVHGDFKGPNILIFSTEAGWKVAAVLDWEFAYAGSPLSDLGTVIRHQARFNPAFKKPFVEGFEQGGKKLPGEWEKAARLLDLLNLADFLNRPAPDPTLREEVTRLITGTVKTYGV